MSSLRFHRASLPNSSGDMAKTLEKSSADRCLCEGTHRQLRVGAVPGTKGTQIAAQVFSPPDRSPPAAPHLSASAYLKPHSIYARRQLGSPLVGHHQHLIGIDLRGREGHLRLRKSPVHISPLLPRPLSTCRGHCVHAILPSIARSCPAAAHDHLQEDPKRIQLAWLHPPLPTPLWQPGPLPSPSAPAHRARSSPGPSSPSGPLRSGETKAAVSQSWAGRPSQPYPGLFSLHQATPRPLTHRPPTLPGAWPWLRALHLFPSRGHSPAGLRETRVLAQRPPPQVGQASTPGSSAAPHPQAAGSLGCPSPFSSLLLTWASSLTS